MPTELINLELDELSLVPRGANQMAKAPIFKADTSNGEDMTDKIKEAAELVSKVEALEAEVSKIKADNERLRKGFLDEGYTIREDSITKAAPAEYLVVEGESINKADIPAPILKALEASAELAKVHELEKADLALVAKAGEALPHFDITAAKALYKAFGEDELILAALKAADKAFESTMLELGKKDEDTSFTSAKDKMDEMVKAYMRERKMAPKDFAKAYAEVAKTPEGKDMITKSYKEKGE
jgi:hypothetical protein